MKKDNKYVRYEEALTDNEILSYAQMVDKFSKDEINYHTLKDFFNNNGVNVQPVPNDFSNRMMTIDQADEIKKRIVEEKYLYDDINYFLLDSNDFKNVVFRIDYKAIEVLANSGNPEYQQTLISILMTQLSHSSDKDEEMVAKRSKWRRQISELEDSLAKKNTIDNRNSFKI